MTRIYETVVYADDVRAVADFYRDVVGLREIDSPDPHSAALRPPEGGGVVLIFNAERASAPDRFVPSHGTRGAGHIAFQVDSLDEAARSLAVHGVEIEREIAWPKGGRSVYFRDPAGTSVEFVEGEIWAP